MDITTVSQISNPSASFSSLASPRDIGRYLGLLDRVSPEMSASEMRSAISSIPGIEIRPSTPGSRSEPFWGVFPERFNLLAPKYRERIERIVNLLELGDKLEPEKTFFSLDPRDYFVAEGRTIRGIKIKGISQHVLPVAVGQARYIRNVGWGNVPLLEQHINAAGEYTPIINRVGEPYGSKRFRGMFSEVLNTECQVLLGNPSMLPLSIGILEAARLRYKGEPSAFFVAGAENPDDQRVSQSVLQQHDVLFDRDVESGRYPSSTEIVTKFNEILLSTREELTLFIEQLYGLHSSGFVHYSPTPDNAGIHVDRVYFVDWEPGAHRSRLSHAQFVKSVCYDIMSVVDYCCYIEKELLLPLAEDVNRIYRGLLIEPFALTNWTAVYFRLQKLSEQFLDQMNQRFPLEPGSLESAKQFRREIEPIIDEMWGNGSFGSGVDWKGAATPFSPKYRDDVRLQVPTEDSSLELQLYVPYGMAPYGCDFAPHPHPALKEFEELIYLGKFSEAQLLLSDMATWPELADFQGYIDYNLAILNYRERHDQIAGWHFGRALRGYAKDHHVPALQLPRVEDLL